MARYWLRHWRTHLRSCRRNDYMRAYCDMRRDLIRRPGHYRALVADIPATPLYLKRDRG